MPDKPLQRRSSETIEVTFDPNRCAHAAECLRRAPEVFDLQARPWMQPEHLDAESLAEVVRQCPSGALRYHRLDGAADEAPDSEVTFRPQRNGPVNVRGNVQLTDAEGAVFATGPRFALCRCGQSGNKPFCDGSHRAAGFRAP